MDFPENLYWGVLLKPDKKIQVRLKWDKKIQITCRPAYIYDYFG